MMPTNREVIEALAKACVKMRPDALYQLDGDGLRMAGSSRGWNPLESLDDVAEVEAVVCQDEELGWLYEQRMRNEFADSRIGLITASARVRAMACYSVLKGDQ